MTTPNGSPVTQREFDRYIRGTDSQLSEIKATLTKVSDKIDDMAQALTASDARLEEVKSGLSKVASKVEQLTEERVPGIEQKMQALSLKQKVMVSGLGLLGGGLGQAVIALFEKVLGS